MSESIGSALVVSGLSCHGHIMDYIHVGGVYDGVEGEHIGELFISLKLEWFDGGTLVPNEAACSLQE